MENKIHPNRKYALDESVLDEIDTEEKAYFLGFFFADGCNRPTHGYLVINVHEKDSYILHKFCRLFKTNKPIYSNKPKSESYQPTHTFQINSRTLSQRLIDLGCGPQKTYSVDFPDYLNPTLVPHFFRGWFDGDGCISRNENKNGKCNSVKISGTDKICLGAQAVLLKVLGVRSAVRQITRTKMSNFNSLEITKHTDIVQLGDWMYGSATIFLARKKERFDFIKSLSVRTITSKFDTNKVCSVCGSEEVYANHMCSVHYERAKKAKLTDEQRMVRRQKDRIRAREKYRKLNGII